MDQNTLISNIYTSSGNQALIQQCLGMIAQSVGAHAAGLIFQQSRHQAPVKGYFYNVDLSYWPSYEQHYHQHDVWLDTVQRIKPQSGEVFVGSHYIPIKAFRKTVGFNEFFKPQDIGDVICVSLPMSSMQVAVLSLWHPVNQGAFRHEQVQQIEELVEHLLAAFQLQHKMEAQSINSMFFEQASNSAQTAWLMVDSDGNHLQSTEQAKHIFSQHDGISLKNNRLHITSVAAEKAIYQQLCSLCRKKPSDSTKPAPAKGNKLPTANRNEPVQIRIPRPSGASDYIANIYPAIIRDSLLYASKSYVFISLVDLHQKVILQNQSLEQLFGLTPSEAVVAVAISNGQSLEAIAQQRGVSLGTVRNQLKAIFHKTQTDKQSHLVSLLNKLSMV